MNIKSKQKSLRHFTVPTWIIKQFYLIKAELLSLRLNWQWSLLIVLVSPLSMLLFLYFLMDGNSEYMFYVISGNIVMSLVTGTMLTLGQELGFLKDIRGFDYYAALPLKKTNLIIAYLVRATITAIPSIIVLIIVGKLLFKINIAIHFSFPIIVILSGFSLSGLGSLIGIYSRNSGQANILTQILQPIIVYCAPVFTPAEKMPNMIRIVSHFIPTTYVAKALRSSFVGVFDWTDILMLVAFCAISVILVEFKIDWRQK